MLRGTRLLLVEDDVFTAFSLAETLQERGATIVGPAFSVSGAFGALADRAQPIDAAVLDIKLGRETSFPVADALLERGIPFAFFSSYSLEVPEHHMAVPFFQKSIEWNSFARRLRLLVLKREGLTQ